jgi:magnesium chelatase family protein
MMLASMVERSQVNQNVLEVLRQPLEDRIISISKAKYSTEYLASFMLVALMSKAPCEADKQTQGNNLL